MPMLGREPRLLGRAKPPPRDEPELGRRTLLARLGPVLGRPPTALPDLEAPVLGRCTALLRDGLLGGRLTELLLQNVGDVGRRTLLAREGLTRGWLTTALLGRDRGTELVSVGPAPDRPTAVVRAVEPGGR